MKKISLLVVFTLLIGLFFATTQAFASPGTTVDAKKTPHTPGPPTGHTPGPKNTPGAQATAHAGQHGKPQILRGTISAVDASGLTLTLGDGSSVTVALTSSTRIKIPGSKDSGATLQPEMKAMVMAYADENGNLTARSVMAIPGQPIRVHRVGWVTDYTAGSSITIQASGGNSSTFSLTADTKILPANRAGDLATGARVTIIAPRNPSGTGWTVIGIVVHPEGSGAGSQPPTTTAP